MKIQKASIANIVTLFALTFYGCTTTTTKVKDPIFNVDTKLIQKNLIDIVKCEKVNVYGKEITTEGKTFSKLEITILNGQNIPVADSSFDILGKAIAEEMKKSLKDKSEYNEYTVKFVTEKTDGSVTKSKWKSVDFKTEDL